MKINLKGRRFNDLQPVLERNMKWEQQSCLQQWERRLVRCVHFKGNFCEGDSTDLEPRILHLYQWSSPVTFDTQLVYECETTGLFTEPTSSVGVDDEWSVRRRDLYLTTHSTHSGQTPMTPQSQQGSSHWHARSQNLLGFNSLHKIWNTRHFYISNKVRGRANSSDWEKPSLSVRNQYLPFSLPDNGKSYTFPNNVFSFLFRENGKR